jgi:hypothetical protein
MDIGTFTEQLEDAEMSDGAWNPEVYIRIGLHQVKVSKIEYCPETDDEEEAIIIS